MEQTEIVLVTDESGSAFPKVSSKDSDSEIQLRDLEETNVVITGGGVEAVHDTSVWSESRRPIV
jgi:hypothetical protein